MLGIKEKLALQKSVKEGIDKLKAGISDLRARLALQKEIKESLDKLKGKTGKIDNLVEQFLAGKFIKEKPNKFFSIFMKVYGLVQGKLDDLKKPIIDYIKANKPDAITESTISAQAGNGGLSPEALQQIINAMAANGKTSITINFG